MQIGDQSLVLQMRRECGSVVANESAGVQEHT
jgi:hypothetical protein